MEILIAGCGTGRHAIDTAKRFPDAQVLAIDLSMSSLCYASRKSAELGVRNIRYAQADIMRLDAIDRAFDVIESVGVLHHLEDPVAGWKALLERLRPGGLMYLGLYSELARASVAMARAWIAHEGYGTTAAEIRRCRQALTERMDDPQWRQLTTSGDFFTLSGCRDLLFHAQEHRFTLPRIARILSDLDLRFLGFIIDRTLIDRYLERFPDDPSATNLEHWHEFETQHPTTFSSMYQFWVQRPQ